MTNTTDPKLFAKMAEIMMQVRHLAKDGRNQYDKYDYVTADTIAIVIGQKLAQASLAFIPSVVDVESTPYTTAKGAEHIRTVVRMQMTLACGETGAVWSSMWAGEAIDRSDKSINKAITSACKYFLLKTFLLAGGDDADAEAESPPAPAQAQQAQPVSHKTLSQDGWAIVKSWDNSPQVAQQWAVDNGGCANIHEAHNSFAKIVKEKFAGALTRENVGEALVEYYVRQMEKLAQKQEAAE